MQEKELFERKSLLPFRTNFSALIGWKKKDFSFGSVVGAIQHHLHVDGRCAAVSSTQMRITLCTEVWRKIRGEQKLCKRFRVLCDTEKENGVEARKQTEQKTKKLRKIWKKNMLNNK